MWRWKSKKSLPPLPHPKSIPHAPHFPPLPACYTPQEGGGEGGGPFYISFCDLTYRHIYSETLERTRSSRHVQQVAENVVPAKTQIHGELQKRNFLHTNVLIHPESRTPAVPENGCEDQDRVRLLVPYACCG